MQCIVFNPSKTSTNQNFIPFLRSVLCFSGFHARNKLGFSGRGVTFPYGFPEASALPRHGLGLNHWVQKGFFEGEMGREKLVGNGCL